jgi:hypothetical protein
MPSCGPEFAKVLREVVSSQYSRWPDRSESYLRAVTSCGAKVCKTPALLMKLSQRAL